MNCITYTPLGSYLSPHFPLHCPIPATGEEHIFTVLPTEEANSCLRAFIRVSLPRPCFPSATSMAVLFSLGPPLQCHLIRGAFPISLFNTTLFHHSVPLLSCFYFPSQHSPPPKLCQMSMSPSTGTQAAREQKFQFTVVSLVPAALVRSQQALNKLLQLYIKCFSTG